MPVTQPTWRRRQRWQRRKPAVPSPGRRERRL
jgi:hypothetical protein